MRLKASLLLVVALLLLALPGRADEPLSVWGVAPGMSADQVRASLGTPEVEQKASSTWCYRKGVRGLDDPKVYFAPSGQVQFVAGTRLTRGGEVVLQRGASPQDLQKLLGDPTSTTTLRGGATMYRYEPLQLFAVVAAVEGRPVGILVFGLGQEPGPAAP